MSYLGIPLAMLIMLVAQRLERRVGPAGAGWVAALPLSFAVAAATLTVTAGRVDAHTLSISAAGHLASQILYGLSFTWAAARWGVARGFASAVAVYALVAVALVSIDPLTRIVVGLAVLALGTVVVSRHDHVAPRGGASSKTQQLLALGSAGLVVAIITVTDRLGGPLLAGTLGAFPTMSTTIVFFVAGRSPEAVRGVMTGLVRSLPCYVAYCTTFALTVTRLPLALATASAVVVALVVAGGTWRVVATRAAEAALVASS